MMPEILTPDPPSLKPTKHLPHPSPSLFLRGLPPGVCPISRGNFIEVPTDGKQKEPYEEK